MPWTSMEYLCRFLASWPDALTEPVVWSEDEADGGAEACEPVTWDNVETEVREPVAWVVGEACD